MARWDAILTLPVQNPPIPEFSSADIVWSRVEGWKEMMDRVALIPFTRINDFVRGESNRKECPTKFHVEARRRRPPDMPYKPKVDGILEYILYWCSFGPDDHRTGGVVRPSRTYCAKRKTPAGRPNTKRGCTCHFIVKRLIAEPTVALIIYNHEKHVDKQGSPCHGPLDSKAAGTRAMFAPYISEELRLQVTSLLHVGVPVETIMQRHGEAVQRQGGPRNRDDLLSHRYVRRLERKIRRSSFELDADDAVSVKLLADAHQDYVFFFEDYSESEAFVLGIQTEWQLQQLVRFGNRGLVVSDSCFGANKLKCPVQSLLVFDEKRSAIPVAWIVTPGFARQEVHRWLRPLYDRVLSKDPNWKLGGFVIDDPSANIHSIREVFRCSVLFCHWRLRHSWHKNIMRRCEDEEMRAEISRSLGDAVSLVCREGGDVDLFDAFMEDFVDCVDFMDYFKSTWVPRLGAWVAALRSLPVATAETCAAMESYHGQLKRRLVNEADKTVYQRVDWLVDKLGSKVHAYYWLDGFSGKASFARYWKDEWKSDPTPWRQALEIPDDDVILLGQGKTVAVRGGDGGAVRNAGGEFALCDCALAAEGSLCKHAIKATAWLRRRAAAPPSASLVKFGQILGEILSCPPRDSVIRDHAVAMAVAVEALLARRRLAGEDKGQTA
ncbi:zinc ion binding protein [Wolffia australiana]